MKATGERWERRRWREARPERVAAVDRCQGAPTTQADVGHRNREMVAPTLGLLRSGRIEI